MTPELTVLVTTCDRAEKLRRVLEDLDRQTIAPSRFEVLVSDDGSSPPAAEAMAGLRLGYSIRYVSGPRSGPARARNRALALARAPLLLFLNDDLWLEPDLLETHLAAQASCHRPTAILGRFEFTPEIRRQALNRLVEEVGVYGTAHLPPGVLLTPLAFCTGNLSVPVAEVIAVGGFDPTFPEPAGEDLDLGYRLEQERGVHLLFDSRARAWHDHPHDFYSWRERWTMWGRAFWRLAAKHQDPLFWPGGVGNSAWASRHAARARILAQEPVANELIGWLERLSCGTAPNATVRVECLDRSFRLPDEAELLMRIGLNINLYYVQKAFWDAACAGHDVEETACASAA